MRKLSVYLLALFVAVLLAAGPVWAQRREAKPRQKAESGLPGVPTCQFMKQKMVMGGIRPFMMAKGLGNSFDQVFHRLGCPGFFVRHTEHLGLSDEQVDDLKAIERDQSKSVIRKKAEIQIAHVELEELLDYEPVNFDKVRAKISGIGDLEQEILLGRLTTIQKARKILTAEQLKKARTLKKTCCPKKLGSERPFLRKKMRPAMEK